MLDFADRPYEWIKPVPSPVLGRMIRRYNARRFLPRVKRIVEVRRRGGDDLLARLTGGDRLLLLPNHPTHADAAVFMESLREIGVPSQLMAAYDVFLRGKVDRFVMRRMGAFSVDRDASDPRPIKHAMDVLTRGRQALTIFPEGNVYLENDRVGPFQDGAAFLALRAQQKISETGRILAVPVAIKASFVGDARPEVRRRLTSLAEAVGVPGLDATPDASDPRSALMRLGTTAMKRNLKLRGLDCPWEQLGDAADEHADLPGLIRCAASGILDRLESKLDLSPRDPEALTDRVRICRRVIHEVRVDPARQADHAAAATWADEAILALRLMSYSGTYLAEKVSVDRVAETAEKLEEDVFGRMPEPFGDRLAVVRFGEPIDLRERLAEAGKLRQAVRTVTAETEASVQAGLDGINETLETSGAKSWFSD
ncbi:MAG: lysophospholipid acyltransferase family protein [Planctomycetota bacterium]